MNPGLSGRLCCTHSFRKDSPKSSFKKNVLPVNYGVASSRDQQQWSKRGRAILFRDLKSRVPHDFQPLLSLMEQFKKKTDKEDISMPACPATKSVAIRHPR